MHVSTHKLLKINVDNNSYSGLLCKAFSVLLSSLGSAVFGNAHLQLEKSCAQLQQQHMRQPVFMHNQNPFDRPPHSNLVKFLSHALEPSSH